MTDKPEDAERHWLEHVYQGTQVRQLTVRAVITGMLLGVIMALSNLYVVLKTGWSLGVTITAAILGFLLWKGIGGVFRKTPEFGILENNAMQSVASAAGYMTGGGTVAAIGGLLILTRTPMDPWVMFVWIASLAFLGVFVAIPLKRQLINVEQLPFPTGTASAETVRSLHAEGSEARQKAVALAVAALAGAALILLRDLAHLFPENLPAFGAGALAWTFSIEGSVVLVGAGAIMGLRVAYSQLLGALLCFGVAAPWAWEQGAILAPLKDKNILSWTVWFGASMMLTAGLLEFAFGWRAVARAFSDLAGIFRSRRPASVDPLAGVEVPSSWFATGMLVLAPLVVVLAHAFFAIPWWMGLIAVLMSLVIAIVAARSTGQTDTTPTSAMGKLVQVTFGVIHPGNVTTNLMTAQMCGGVAIHSADLLTDLKSGYLLGARPRQQFIAQFFGVIAGSLAVVPAFALLVPDASVIPEKFAAPTALTWAAVAELMAKGVSALHPTARWFALAGGALGIVLVLLERTLPRHRAFIPSPLAFGLAWTFAARFSISIAIGASLAWLFARRSPRLAALFVVPVASGLIAGESLTAIGVNLGQAGLHQLLYFLWP